MARAALVSPVGVLQSACAISYRESANQHDAGALFALLDVEAHCSLKTMLTDYKDQIGGKEADEGDGLVRAACASHSLEPSSTR